MRRALSDAGRTRNGRNDGKRHRNRDDRFRADRYDSAARIDLQAADRENDHSCRNDRHRDIGKEKIMVAKMAKQRYRGDRDNRNGRDNRTHRHKTEQIQKKIMQNTRLLSQAGQITDKAHLKREMGFVFC